MANFKKIKSLKDAFEVSEDGELDEIKQWFDRMKLYADLN